MTFSCVLWWYFRNCFDFSGTQIGFIRSCTPTESEGDEEFCKITNNDDPGAPAQLCYHTCDYDGCNHGNTLTHSIFLILPVLTSTVLSFCLWSYHVIWTTSNKTPAISIVNVQHVWIPKIWSLKTLNSNPHWTFVIIGSLSFLC